ncbi:MAG: glycosyltransferase family 2 protein [Sphingobacteriales bacterium]|nr:MAG: glycosyltransferase family 2 protein [Sphingobacteriales bacterium]
MEISVVVPVHNEEGNIIPLHQELCDVLRNIEVEFEIVFVNDGSTDQSINIIKELATQHSYIKYLDFSKNFGHQLSVFAGLEYATGNYIVIIDADLQDPPALIKNLYHKIKEGYDVVYAQRTYRKDETWLKLFTAKSFYRFINQMSDVYIPVDTGDYRIITQQIRDVICSMPEHNKFLRGQIAWAGFKQTGVPYERMGRHSGSTNYSYAKMFQFAYDGIVSFSNTPLRLATYLGFAVSLFAFVIIIYTLYQKYANQNTIQGWSSIMLSVLFLGGIQLICIGIIGEYIARILDNVKNRPQYIVKESNIEKPKK